MQGIKTYEVTIQGISPLLMNRFNEAAEVSVSSGTRKSTRTKMDPREDAKSRAYIESKTDELYIPGPNIFACLVEAGKFFKLGKNKVTTMKSSLVPAGMQISELVCSLGTKTFEVDSRRVVIAAAGGAAVMRHRPRLDEWETTFHVEVDTELFNPELARDIVDAAGKRIGLGDFRPARRGPFGRFVVTKWSEVEG